MQHTEKLSQLGLPWKRKELITPGWGAGPRQLASKAPGRWSPHGEKYTSARAGGQECSPASV